jgi:hypothetical protein
LETLLARVKPMTREPDPEALLSSRRFHAALAALRGARVLDDETAAAWRTRELAATAPWLGDEELTAPGGGQIIALHIPASSPEEAARDAEAERELEQLLRRGSVRRVLVPRATVRHGGLTIVAVLARTDSTEVLFHHVGGPQGVIVPSFAAMEEHGREFQGLTPPRLTDDAGTSYAPVADTAVGGHGVGGSMDPERPRVWHGVWRYQPAAPDTATVFEVQGPANSGATSMKIR